MSSSLRSWPAGDDLAGAQARLDNLDVSLLEVAAFWRDEHGGDDGSTHTNWVAVRQATARPARLTLIATTPAAVTQVIQSQVGLGKSFLTAGEIYVGGVATTVAAFRG